MNLGTPYSIHRFKSACLSYDPGSWRFVSPLHLCLRVAYIELHHVNELREIVGADGHVATLQRFVLLAM